MKKIKSKNIIHPEDKVELIENTKTPIFVLGILFWLALFVFIFGTTYLKFNTGHVISSGDTFGTSTSIFIVVLFVVLSVLLFLVYKYLIKKPKRQ